MSVKPYDAYRVSGVGWLESVPRHWTVVSPKRYIESAPGGTKIKGQCSSEPVTGFVRGFSASGQDIWLPEPDYTRDGLVLSAVGARCGRTFKADGRWGVAANTHCLFPRSNASRDYLWYLTNSEHWWEKGGAAQPFVHVKSTLSRTWAFPPLNEQHAIATFLDRETAKIDALVAEQRRLIALLKDKRQAVISHAVTKGLNPDAPMKPSGIEWLGDVPEHWEVMPLMRLTPDDRQIMYGIILPGPSVDEGVPIVKGGDVKPNRLRVGSLSKTTFEIESKYARSRLRPGDLVYSIRGSIGDVEIVPNDLCGANITQDAARITPLDSVSSEWLLYALRSNGVFCQLDQTASGATIRGINIYRLKRAKIPIPPKAEQQQISEFLRSQCGSIDLLVAAATHASAILQERRTALISAAVTGKIDVREHDTQETA